MEEEMMLTQELISQSRISQPLIKDGKMNLDSKMKLHSTLKELELKKLQPNSPLMKSSLNIVMLFHMLLFLMLMELILEHLMETTLQDLLQELLLKEQMLLKLKIGLPISQVHLVKESTPNSMKILIDFILSTSISNKVLELHLEAVMDLDLSDL